MKNDLIERYIYAVARNLAPKMRADVEKELDSPIDDMLTARCGEVLPTDRDIRVVLTELGTPEELAARYNTDENNALISGSYYIFYTHLLKIVLPVAAGGIMLAGVLTAIVNWDSELNTYLQLGQAFGLTLAEMTGGVIQAFAILTFIFAVLERQHVAINGGDMFSHLPPVPKGKAQIKPHEPIISIAFSIFATVIFLVFPQVIGVWSSETGWVSVFEPSIIRSLWIPIVLWTVMGIARESVKLVDGQYSRRLVAVTVFCNGMAVFIIFGIFMNEHILNSRFAQVISQLFVGDDEAIAALIWAFSHCNVIFVCLAMFGLVVDFAVTIFRAQQTGTIRSRATERE